MEQTNETFSVIDRALNNLFYFNFEMFDSIIDIKLMIVRETKSNFIDATVLILN